MEIQPDWKVEGERGEERLAAENEKVRAYAKVRFCPPDPRYRAVQGPGVPRNLSHPIKADQRLRFGTGYLKDSKIALSIVRMCHVRC